MTSSEAAFPLAAMALFLSHAVPSAPGVRETLVGLLGRRAFLALYSLASLAALGWFLAAYQAAQDGAAWWVPPDWAAGAAVALMPVASLLVALRLATPLGEPAAPHPPRGIYRVTRVPGSLGLLLWAGLHLLATGDGRRVVLFATMAAIALWAIAKNEWLLARADGMAARRFREETSLVPGAAIAAGRQRWPAGEIGWPAPALALAAYALVLALHPHLFGVDPLWQWR